jgi:uncharacterized protein (DUF1015 family)
MQLIKSFKALRPSPEKADEVIAPPYDVLNSEEAREMSINKPYSFLHISKPEIDLPLGIKTDNPEVYKKGAENLLKMINDKVLIQEESECIYVYEITINDTMQTGIACVASVDAYEKNHIKKHEFTKPVKEDDRVMNITELKAQTGPVLLAYKNTIIISKLLTKAKEEKALYSVSAPDGSSHKVWLVSDPKEIQSILSEINSMESLFIADGHHRSAAASRVKNSMSKDNENHTGEEDYNFFLSVAFPHSEMTILDYNRIIKELNNHTEDELLLSIEENFHVTKSLEQFRPAQKGEFGMYIKKEWYKLKIKEDKIDKEDPVKSLDVSILHDFLIEPFLGIQDERTDQRIDFVGGARGLSELERRVDNQGFKVAFSLFPTPIEALIDVANANKVMPPKSTWFEPKLLDGLLSHKI